MADKLIRIEMFKLDEIKKDYERAGGELRTQLKVEWNNKTKEIAAIIRRECGKNHGTRNMDRGNCRG